MCRLVLDFPYSGYKSLSIPLMILYTSMEESLDLAYQARFILPWGLMKSRSPAWRDDDGKDSHSIASTVIASQLLDRDLWYCVWSLHILRDPVGFPPRYSAFRTCSKCMQVYRWIGRCKFPLVNDGILKGANENVRWYNGTTVGLMLPRTWWSVWSQ